MNNPDPLNEHMKGDVANEQTILQYLESERHKIHYIDRYGRHQRKCQSCHIIVLAEKNQFEHKCGGQLV